MTTTWTTAPAIGRPARTATWIAVLLAIAGIVGAVAYAGVGLFEAWQAPDGFARSAAGGTVTTRLETGQDAVVFVEGGAPVIAPLALQVTAPDGDGVAVRAYGGTLQYDRADALATSVGIFTAPVGGTYMVVSTVDLAGGHLAVGSDIGAAVVGRLGQAGLIALLGLVLAAAIGIGASLVTGRRTS